MRFYYTYENISKNYELTFSKNNLSVSISSLINECCIIVIMKNC